MPPRGPKELEPRLAIAAAILNMAEFLPQMELKKEVEKTLMKVIGLELKEPLRFAA